nr:hypothetical protein [Exilibacterium tricleocarpae]
MTDGTNSANNRHYGYDSLGRLTSAEGPWGSGSYKYDALANLREKKLGTRRVTLAYDNRNRVTSSSDSIAGTRQIRYDGRGNVTTLGALSFVYDQAQQPVSVSGSATGSYAYDGNLRRVKSVMDGKTIYNVYSAAGKLVHVDAVSDNRRTDYVAVFCVSPMACRPTCIPTTWAPRWPAPMPRARSCGQSAIRPLARSWWTMLPIKTWAASPGISTTAPRV